MGHRHHQALTLQGGQRLLDGEVALREAASGGDVIEYSERTGGATQAIAPGAHVHVHNVKSVRWSV